MPSIRELIHGTKSFHVNLQIISIRCMCKATVRFSITNILLWDECDSSVEIRLDHFPSLNSSYIVHVVITLQMKLIEFSRLLKKKRYFSAHPEQDQNYHRSDTRLNATCANLSSHPCDSSWIIYLKGGSKTDNYYTNSWFIRQKDRQDFETP